MERHKNLLSIIETDSKHNKSKKNKSKKKIKNKHTTEHNNRDELDSLDEVLSTSKLKTQHDVKNKSSISSFDYPISSIKIKTLSKSSLKSSDTSDEAEAPSPIKVKVEQKSKKKINNSQFAPVINYLDSEFISGEKSALAKNVKLERIGKTKHVITRNESESDTSDEVDVPSPMKVKLKQNNKLKKKMRQSVAATKSLDLDSSSEEVKVPMPKYVKLKQKEKVKNVITRNKSETDTSDEPDLPLPIKVKVKQKNKMKGNNRVPASITRSSDSNSSFEEEAEEPLPKRVKMEKIKKHKNVIAQKKPELDMSDVNEVTLPNKVKKKPKNIMKANNHKPVPLDSESSSGEEAKVPLPKNCKFEQIEKINNFVVQKKSKTDTVKVEQKCKIIANNQPVASIKSSDSDSSSEGEAEVPLPKHVKLEQVAKTKDVVIRKKSESDSSDEADIPSPMKVKVEQKNRLKGKVHYVAASKAFGSDSEEATVPLPKNIKQEHMGKINNVVTFEKSASGTSDEDDVPPVNVKLEQKSNIKGKIRQPIAATKSSDSDSTSEDAEVPLPKHVKLKQTAKIKNMFTQKKLKSDTTDEAEKLASSDDNSSEEESTVPSPIKIKTEKQNALTGILKTSQMNKKPEKSSDSSDNNSIVENEQSKGITSNGFKSAINHNNNMETSPTEESSEEIHRNSRINILQQVIIKPTWTEKLNLCYPNLKKQNTKMVLPDSESTEYYVLRIPKNIDPNILVKLKWDLKTETKVTLRNKEYIFQPLPKKPEPTLLNLNGPMLLHIKGIHVLQKYVSPTPIQNTKVTERVNVPLPSAVKKRHPLFGVKYKKKIRLDMEIEKRIREAIENKIKQEKKRKKRKFKTNPKDEDASNNASLLEMFNLDTLKSTSKETGLDLFMTPKSTKLNDNSGINNPSSKKRKTKKTLIEENLLSIKNMLNVTEFKNEPELSNSSIKKHKRKKIKKAQTLHF